MARTFCLLSLGASLLLAAWSNAQVGAKKADAGASDFINRMFAFDKDKDASLAKDEIGDARLHMLFARADADKNGAVSRQELEELYSRETALYGTGRGGFGPPGFGPPGFGKKGPKKGPPSK